MQDHEHHLDSAHALTGQMSEYAQHASNLGTEAAAHVSNAAKDIEGMHNELRDTANHIATTFADETDVKRDFDSGGSIN